MPSTQNLHIMELQDAWDKGIYIGLISGRLPGGQLSLA